MVKKLASALFVIGLLLLAYFAVPEPSEVQRTDDTDQRVSIEELNKPGLHNYTQPEAEVQEDPYAPLPNGRTALTQAAFDGDIDHLNRLHLLTKPRNLSRPDGNGDNTLIAAVAGGHHSLAKDLMDTGVTFDREAFKRLSKTLDPTDTDEMEWWLNRKLPFADPQVLKTLYDPSIPSYFDFILGGGYRPTREEAFTMLSERMVMNSDSFVQLYNLYPELFSQENIIDAFNPINFATASPKQRELMESLLPTIQYKDNDRDFEEMIKRFPYDLLVTYPDYARFSAEHRGHIGYYCSSRDESAVVLLDQGVECISENPFGEAVDHYNYALVQRYIDTGTNPKKAFLYDKPVMEVALSHDSEEKLEMAKLLIDNGAATPDQVNRFYSMMYKLGNPADRYRPYPNLPLKLAASPQDDLYVLSYSNKEKRYQLSRQDSSGTILWDQVLGEERFFNILDNPAGLYFKEGKLLLVQNRFLDGRRKTQLSLFSDSGELLQQVDVKGVFEALIMQHEGYALTTNRTTFFYDNSLKSLGDITSHPDAFLPAVSLKTAGLLTRHRYFAYDHQKLDFYPDRTLMLFRPGVKYASSKPPRMVSRYLASILSKDGNISKTALIGSGDLIPMDYALSDSHAYIILAGPEQVVIQKRSSDFEVKTFHYLDLDSSPIATTIDSMSCDTSGCTILGRANRKLALIRTIPGTKQQTLTTTDIKYDLFDDDLDWQVARIGDQDFVSGSLQLRFENAKPTAKGEALFLDSTLGLVAGPNDTIYAFGSHNKDAAYEVVDAKGDLLGHYELDFGYVDSHINEMKRLPDGKLLVIGHLYQHYHLFYTYAVLLTPQGKPIWSRVYHDMDSMHGLLLDPENNLFYTIAGGETVVKLSLEDGSLIKQLDAVKGLNHLLRTAQGQIIGIGENEQSYGKHEDDKVNQPVIYCLAQDEATFTAQLQVGDPGDKILAAAPWKEGLVAAYIKDADGSVRSNAMLAQINTETCQISFDWKP